jgi:hypothetical protein
MAHPGRLFAEHGHAMQWPCEHQHTGLAQVARRTLQRSVRHACLYATGYTLHGLAGHLVDVPALNDALVARGPVGRRRVHRSVHTPRRLRARPSGYGQIQQFVVQTFDEFSEMEIRPKIGVSCRRLD